MSIKRSERDYSAMLNPQELRSALLLVSLYVLAFESFKDGVVDHLRIMHSRGFDESGWLINEDEYRVNVLSRHQNPFRASLHWFHEFGAIDAVDLESIERLTATRNRLVHELGKLVGTKELAPELTSFAELLRVYRKVEVWWVLNFEVDGNPDFDGQEIDENEVIPGSLLMLRMLVDVAFGNDDEAWAWHKAFNESQYGSPSSEAGNSELAG